MLYKIKIFDTSWSQIRTDEYYKYNIPSTRIVTRFQHYKRIGRCRLDTLDDITYDDPILEAETWGKPASYIPSTFDIGTRLKRAKNCDALKFDFNAHLMKQMKNYFYEQWLMIPDDEIPNIFAKTAEALQAAVQGLLLKVVIMETNVYVFSCVGEHKQIIDTITNMHHHLTICINAVTKIYVYNSNESLRKVSSGDSLELLTMRLRQRECAICLDDTDDVSVERRIMCLPCSHLYHEDCIFLWLAGRMTCPLCRYLISVKKVQCKLPCDWPRRHRVRQHRLNLFKILKTCYRVFQMAYTFYVFCILDHNGNCAGLSLWDIVKPWWLRPKTPAYLRRPDQLKKKNWFLSWMGGNKMGEEIKIAEIEKRRKWAENKILMHFKFNF